ncbi:large conductance mechanosensitive channel protein MscL [Candidatus Nomurabacteria bacterium]|nr:large conductance mechanosensitive channel protein MscL [Candidatus Nomurabacteria bacterium]
MLKEFKQFLLRGNVVDLLVGVVIGSSFGALVGAFVSDFVTPFIAAIIKIPDFSKLSFSLNGSVFMYGHFLNTAISFVLVAGVIFLFIVKPVNIFMSKKNKQPEEK